jgi:hypothetical protein
MKRFLTAVMVFSVLLLGSTEGFCQTKGTVRCVGLYSETAAGSISYREGSGEWVVANVGDTIPANAEIRVNVDRDWIEVSPSDNPNAVYEIPGKESGVVLIKVADLLKQKPRSVTFPAASGGSPDPKFRDKQVVTENRGRQIYMTSDGDTKDIKYGDVLDRTGKVTIIAINNTITLMNSSGAVTTVIGPLKFDVEQVLTNQKLYKYLNVPWPR